MALITLLKLYPQILAIISTTPNAQNLRDEWNAWVAGHENWSDLSASLTWTQIMGLAGESLDKDFNWWDRILVY